MKIRYCKLCQREVAPFKKFSWAAFLLLCLTGVGGIFYLFWYMSKSKNRCPICNNKI